MYAVLSRRLHYIFFYNLVKCKNIRVLLNRKLMFYRFETIWCIPNISNDLTTLASNQTLLMQSAVSFWCGLTVMASVVVIGAISTIAPVNFKIVMWKLYWIETRKQASRCCECQSFLHNVLISIYFIFTFH